jgi:hypothetical protein
MAWLMPIYCKAPKCLFIRYCFVYLPLINQSYLRFNIIHVMYLSSEWKSEIFAKHGGAAANTGSAEGQVALFTSRIAHLTGHLKKKQKRFCYAIIFAKTGR